MEEASNGVENCIYVAFGVRNEKSRLVEINETLDVAVAVTVPVTSRIHLSGLNCIEIKPSNIMKDHAKVELLFSIFDANGKLSFSEWHDATADAHVCRSSEEGRSSICHAFFTLPKPCESEGEGMSAVKQVLGLGQKESCIGCLLDDCCMPSEGRHFLS